MLATMYTDCKMLMDFLYINFPFQMDTTLFLLKTNELFIFILIFVSKNSTSSV